MDFSIVIPTWNRSNLVDELLNSLFEERIRYQDGKTEVIVVDQCHLLRRGIRKNIFNSSMNFVYLRIHLKSWGFCFS
jgi:cellulose synthase/poly-beta-1,6-N-acetylglucosamine synthase-like glycosyltransferase